MLRTANRHDADDLVIDLRERLAPYEGAVFRPRPRIAPQPVESTEPIPWRRLDLEHLDPSEDESIAVPAVEAMDVMAEAPVPELSPALVAHVRKQPRNERCACDSGQKFKRCCGRSA